MSIAALRLALRAGEPVVRTRKRRGRMPTQLAAVAAAVVAIAPVLWALNTALLPEDDAVKARPHLALGNATIENFADVLRGTNITRLMLNTTIVGIAAAALSTFIAMLAGYAALRLATRTVDLILLGILAVGMLPGIALLPGMYAAAQQTGLHDTHLGLVLVFAAWRLPILVWLLRAYMEAVPKEVEEAAFLDGCNRLSVLFRIVAPLIAPGLISSFLITFVYVWNDFIFGITMTITPEMRTVQVGLYQFMGDMGIRWAPFMAYTILSTLPVLLLFILLQKRFVEGLTAGAAKG